MSGPVLLSFSGDILGGPAVNQLVLNGNDGDAALYIPGNLDELIFDLFIGSKLNAKEMVCGVKPSPSPKACKVENIVPVCDKVKP
jgi:hypothetical protein